MKLKNIIYLLLSLATTFIAVYPASYLVALYRFINTKQAKTKEMVKFLEKIDVVKAFLIIDVVLVFLSVLLLMTKTKENMLSLILATASLLITLPLIRYIFSLDLNKHTNSQVQKIEVINVPIDLAISKLVLEGLSIIFVLFNINKMGGLTNYLEKAL